MGHAHVTTPSADDTETYDANGDLTSTTYSGRASGYGASTNASYTYNVDGTVHTMTDATGTTTYGYDAVGDLTSLTNGAGEELTYSYGSGGNLDSREYPNSQTVSYAYNALGEQSSLTDWLGHTTSFGYDPSGDLTTATFPNGVTESTSFDKDSLVSSITATEGSSTLASSGYTRDPNGDITAESDTGTPAPASQSYGYDAAARINSDNSASYTYDAHSDLTTGPGGAAQAFDAAGQLCWSLASPPPGSTCGSTPSGRTTYGFDTLGDRSGTAAPTCDRHLWLGPGRPDDIGQHPGRDRRLQLQRLGPGLHPQPRQWLGQPGLGPGRQF